VYGPEIYEKLIPEDHILCKISKQVDFSFVNEACMSNEPSFAQKLIWSSRNQNSDPIIVKSESIEINSDTRLMDPDIRDADKPLCIGGFDSDSSFCKECQSAEDCQVYKEHLNDEKESKKSSFEER